MISDDVFRSMLLLSRLSGAFVFLLTYTVMVNAPRPVSAAGHSSKLPMHSVNNSRLFAQAVEWTQAGTPIMRVSIRGIARQTPASGVRFPATCCGVGQTLAIVQVGIVIHQNVK